MALDAERELTQWTAGIDVKRTLRIALRCAQRMADGDVKQTFCCTEALALTNSEEQ
jgi:hypothetical protein